MALFIALSISALATTYLTQDKYTYCEEIKFKTEYCETQKKLHESTK